ncbi:MAG TPA: hypothetical protein VKE93_06900 [Candidatus Angelobacter sp.]|nr:hypothetical protein [Candidatus Angelobacter sp.]
MEGNAKTSLVISRILVTFGTLLIGLLVLAFVPFERGHKIGANTSAAASSLRTIYLSSQVYAEKHPQQGYARNLSELAGHPNAGGGEDALIDSVLASGQKVGYRFTYSSQSTKGDGQIDAFQVTAAPLVAGKTGTHHFFVDQTGVIRMSDVGPADSSGVPLQ